MTKLSILTLACVLAFVGATSAAQQDPNKKKVATKPVVKTQVTKQHTANTHLQGNHIQGQGTTRTSTRLNNTHVNKTTTFNPTNKTVNKNKTISNNKTITNNKTVNKVQVNNKVQTLNKTNSANWQKIHQQHQNFHAAKNGQIAGVKFNAKYHIAGAQNWKGKQYLGLQELPSSVARSLLVAQPLPKRHSHRWRLVLLELRILVSRLGI